MKELIELNVKIINKSKHELPKYETLGSAGMDIRANIDEDVTLGSLERKIIPTGLFIQLPVGFEAQIRPRSGLAAKYGVTVLNTPGTIDSDWRGEVGIILINLSTEPFIVHDGDRIAQMIVCDHERVKWNPIDKLEKTERGEKGFGHTGIK